MAKKDKNAKKSAKPTYADAELVLKLYDLRREPELRRARQFVATEFWPKSADDIVALINEFGSQKNAWYRQATTYWDMAASLVVQGILNRELFFEWASELFFVYAKFAPYLKELREKAGTPRAFWNIEKLIEGSPVAQERLAAMQRRIAMRAKAQAASGQK